MRAGDLVVLCGLPGCGKSTFARELEAAHGAVVVAYDALRRADTGHDLNYSRVYGRLLNGIDSAIRRAPVVVEALHLTPDERAYLIHRGARRYAVWWRAEITRCMRRRPSIASASMSRMAAKLEAPTMDEGFDGVAQWRQSTRAWPWDQGERADQQSST